MTKRKPLPRCHGVPVSYDPGLKNISDSRGIWPFKKIVVGPQFLQLSPGEQGAVLLHEVGHCQLYHLEKRIAMMWLVLVSPKRLLRLCLAQEYEADAYAAKEGFAPYLASVFSRLQDAEGVLHPDLALRIERLRKGA